MKKGALPVLFPNFPFYLSNTVNCEKISEKRKSSDTVHGKMEEDETIIAQKEKFSIENKEHPLDSVISIPSDLFPESAHNQNCLFETLFKKEKSIDFLLGWWRHDIDCDNIKVLNFAY